MQSSQAWLVMNAVWVGFLSLKLRFGTTLRLLLNNVDFHLLHSNRLLFDQLELLLQHDRLLFQLLLLSKVLLLLQLPFLELSALLVLSKLVLRRLFRAIEIWDLSGRFFELKELLDSLILFLQELQWFRGVALVFASHFLDISNNILLQIVHYVLQLRFFVALLDRRSSRAA